MQETHYGQGIGGGNLRSLHLFVEGVSISFFLGGGVYIFKQLKFFGGVE